jgi:drug/metabolite transporter (DMT)-like permease
VLGPAMLLFTLLGWSSVPLFVTHFSHAMNVWTQNGWRYLFAAMLWSPVLVWAWMKRTTPRGLWRASLLPAVFNALGQAAFTWSFYNVDTSTAAFGLRTQIVFVPVGAYLLFPSERALLRRPGAWAGIVLVIAGVVGTMLLRDASHDVTRSVGGSGSAAMGMVMAVTAGLLFACYGLAVRKNMHGFHPVTAFAAISQITAVISFVLMLGLSRDEGTHALDWGRAVWGLSAGQMVMLLVSAIIGITLGHAAYFTSIARLGVSTTSGVLQLQPFCVAIAQFAVFGTMMTGGQWVSGVVAVIGALLLLYVQWRLTRAARERVGADAGAGMPPVAGDESEGVEAAEMEAMPVESDGERRR